MPATTSLHSPTPAVLAPTPVDSGVVLVRPPLWAFAMPASIVFLLLFYVLPFGFLGIRALATGLSPKVTSPWVSAVVLLLCFAVIWVLWWLTIQPDEPEALRGRLAKSLLVRMQHRVGLPGADRLGRWLCVMAVPLVVWLGGVVFLPAVVAAFVGLTGALRTGSGAEWSLTNGPRRIMVPVPPEPPEGPGEACELSWDLLRAGGEPIHNHLVLHISPATLATFRQNNPFVSGQVPETRQQRADVAARLVNDGISFELRELGRYLLGQAAKHKLTPYEEVENALRMVQTTIVYTTDEETQGHEYWRFPLETLADRKGDCDCKSVLLAAVLKVIFMLQPECEPLEVVILVSDQQEHAAVAVQGPASLPETFLRIGDQAFYYCESTAEGMRVGELPVGTDLSSFTMIRLTPGDLEPGACE